jgi:protein NrfC
MFPKPSGCVKGGKPVQDQKGGGNEKLHEEISRRDFLRIAGTVAVGAGMGGLFPGLVQLDDAVAAIPVSGGYLLVDVKKCQGCLTCMLACSLVHEGKINLSFSRIQVLENPYEKFPDDIELAQCRQCVEAACAGACPTGALHAAPEHGHVRLIDPEKCIGCKSCIDACPFEPSRAVWNFEKKHAQKCDLCADTPFWKEQGGSGGKQACVEACPLGAIKFTEEVPEQKGDSGYHVNLRKGRWEQLGYSTD